MSKKNKERFEENNQVSNTKTLYRYIGDGRGISGLPHEVTMEEAKARGVEKILVAAILNGKYVVGDEPHTVLPDGEDGTS